MAFSSAGKKKLAAQVFLFLINIVVLALAARINQFQEFFFFADLFPLGLSITTLVLLFFLLTADLILFNAYTGRAHVEIGIFAILSILWLSSLIPDIPGPAFSAFSTSRWQHVPFQCDSIPDGFPDERMWCKDTQVLKGFVWVEFLTCLSIALGILRYAITQNNKGNKHIWQMPLSRYRPHQRSSEFLQY